LKEKKNRAYFVPKRRDACRVFAFILLFFFLLFGLISKVARLIAGLNDPPINATVVVAAN